MFDLTGRVVVVSGASSGLGAQMARGFAGQGADLVIMARRLEKLESLATVSYTHLYEYSSIRSNTPELQRDCRTVQKDGRAGFPYQEWRRRFSRYGY